MLVVFGCKCMNYLGETVEQKALRTEVECCTEVLCRVETRKVALVEMYIVLLVLIAFGPLCPLLFLIAPICVSRGAGTRHGYFLPSDLHAAN